MTSPLLSPDQEMPIEEVTLHGDHVILEPLAHTHVRELVPEALEPGLFQHLAPGTDQSERQLRMWVARRIAEAELGTALPFLMRSPSGKAIGSTSMFNLSERHHRLEIGHTWMVKSHRKSLAGTEATYLLLRHAFKEMRAVRVQFRVDVRNNVGIRALTRIGAVREGRMRNARILIDGWMQDAFVFSIIDREWPEVEKRLHGLLWNPKAVP